MRYVLFQFILLLLFHFLHYSYAQEFVWMHTWLNEVNDLGYNYFYKYADLE